MFWTSDNPLPTLLPLPVFYYSIMPSQLHICQLLKTYRKKMIISTRITALDLQRSDFWLRNLSPPKANGRVAWEKSWSPRSTFNFHLQTQMSAEVGGGLTHKYANQRSFNAVFLFCLTCHGTPISTYPPNLNLPMGTKAPLFLSDLVWCHHSSKVITILHCNILSGLIMLH